MVKKLCICSVCPPGGAWIHAPLYKQHQNTQAALDLYNNAAKSDLDATGASPEATDAMTELHRLERVLDDDLVFVTEPTPTLRFVSTEPMAALSLTDDLTLLFHNTRQSVRNLAGVVRSFDTLGVAELEDNRRHLASRIDAKLAELDKAEEDCREALDRSHQLMLSIQESLPPGEAPGPHRPLDQLLPELSGKLLPQSLYPFVNFLVALKGRPRNVIHFAALFIVSILHALCGLSDNHVQFLLKSLQVIVAITFAYSNTPSHISDPILRHFPSTLWNFSVAGEPETSYLYYTTCPECCACYPPTGPDGSADTRPHCTSLNKHGSVCNAPLITEVVRGNKTYHRATRRYPLRSIGEWMKAIFRTAEREALIDRTWKEFVNGSQRTGNRRWDVWTSDFVRNFPGPSPGPYAEIQGQLLFAIAVDWLNPFGNLTAKKTVSIGAIYLICLNLPLRLRYLVENVCVLAVIPGPREPGFWQIHHFLNPIITELKSLWETGIWVKTNAFPGGRLLRAALALVIGDLPAVKKCLGFTDAGSTSPCHFCTIANYEIDDFRPTFWKPKMRTLATHRDALARLGNAVDGDAREKITKETGVRASAFNDLSYFDPSKHAALDQMHLWCRLPEHLLRDAFNTSECLPSGVCADPFPNWTENTIPDLIQGEQLMLNGSVSALEKSKLGVSVFYELCWRRGLNWHRTKNQMIRVLHQWRVDNGIVLEDGSIRPQLVGMQVTPTLLPTYTDTKGPDKTDPHVQDILLERYFRSQTITYDKVNKYHLPTLQRFLDRLGVDRSDVKLKKDLITKLLNYHAVTVEIDDLTLLPELEEDDEETELPLDAFSILGSDVLQILRQDIANTTFPSWMKRTPRKFGSINFGKLGAEEWKTTTIVSLPVTLLRLWGLSRTALDDLEKSDVEAKKDDTIKKSKSRQYEYLLNLAHLSIAIRLAQRTSVTDASLDYYELHMLAYLEGFKILYPHIRIRPYQHFALHIPDVARLWGPSIVYNANPPEFWNEQLQRLNTNNKFSELEISLANGFSATSALKSMLAYDELPEELKLLKPAISLLLSSKYRGAAATEIFPNRSESTSLDWTFESSDKRPVIVADDVFTSMRMQLKVDPPIKQVMHRCRAIEFGHLRLQPFTASKNNSRVLFRRQDGTTHAAMIDQIFREPDPLPNESGVATGGASHHPGKDGTQALHAPPKPTGGRIFLRLRPFQPLSEQDSERDPYGCNPLLGRLGYDVFRLYYDRTLDELETVAIEDIVSDLCTCAFQDDAYSWPLLVTIVLDRDFVHEPNSSEGLFNLPKTSFKPTGLIAEADSTTVLRGVPLPMTTRPMPHLQKPNASLAKKGKKLPGRAESQVSTNSRKSRGLSATTEPGLVPGSRAQSTGIVGLQRTDTQPEGMMDLDPLHPTPDLDQTTPKASQASGLLRSTSAHQGQPAPLQQATPQSDSNITPKGSSIHRRDDIVPQVASGSSMQSGRSFAPPVVGMTASSSGSTQRPPQTSFNQYLYATNDALYQMQPTFPPNHPRSTSNNLSSAASLPNPYIQRQPANANSLPPLNLHTVHHAMHFGPSTHVSGGQASAPPPTTTQSSNRAVGIAFGRQPSEQTSKRKKLRYDPYKDSDPRSKQ